VLPERLAAGSAGPAHAGHRRHQCQVRLTSLLSRPCFHCISSLEDMLPYATYLHAMVK
jgi:hypothetical protein